MQQTNFTDIMEKNHMEIPWHDYTQIGNILSTKPDLLKRHLFIGRVGLISYPAELVLGAFVLP